MKLFNTLATAFENFDDTVRNYLSKSLGNAGSQYSKSQIFSIIFNGVKGIMQNAMFYIEDAFTEQNIDTAIRAKSVYSLARLSGYEPNYGSAATGTILGKVSVNNRVIDGSASSKIYIKNGTLIKNAETDLIYSIYLPTEYYIVDLSKPIMTHEFKITQGSWKSATYIARGINLETVHIDCNGQFDREYIEVFVDGVKYSCVASLYDMTEDGLQYTVNTGFDNVFDVTFGNGIYGRKLNEAQTVTVRYLNHAGEDGNVYDIDNARFVFHNLCYDSFGNKINANNHIRLQLENQISGGTAPDSIGTVRKMIGYNSRNLVLATEDNFKLFMSRFSFIGSNNVWCEPNSLTITISALSNFKNKLKNISDYLTLTDKDLLLKENQKEMIVSSLNNSNKLFAGLNVKFKDPMIRKYALLCYAKVDSSYNKESVSLSIKDSISKYFINLSDNTSFIPKSDIIKTVLDENKNIESFDFNFISGANEDAYYKGEYVDYELKQFNGSYDYIEINKSYDPSKELGLDGYGNISINGQLEVPLVSSIKYYPNKSEGKKEDCIHIDGVQIFFI